MEGTPWTLVIAIDRAQANEPVTMMVKLAASITALALLLAVAFVTMAVKRQRACPRCNTRCRTSPAATAT